MFFLLSYNSSNVIISLINIDADSTDLADLAYWTDKIVEFDSKSFSSFIKTFLLNSWLWFSNYNLHSSDYKVLLKLAVSLLSFDERICFSEFDRKLKKCEFSFDEPSPSSFIYSNFW